MVVLAFSSLVRIQGECSTVHFPPAHFFFLSFLKGWLAHAYYFHTLHQDQSAVAQRAEVTVAKCPLKSCVGARFWTGSHTMHGQQHSHSTPTLLGQECMWVQVHPATCTLGRMTGVFSSCLLGNTKACLSKLEQSARLAVSCPQIQWLLHRFKNNYFKSKQKARFSVLSAASVTVTEA